MTTLKERLAAQLPALRQEQDALIQQYGSHVISEVSVRQMFGGMRGVKSLICNTSEVTPDKGLIIRGHPIKELKERLPEEVFWLLLTGETPTAEDLTDFQADLKSRNQVPPYVFDILRSMPQESHPMAMFNTAILVMQQESLFSRKYHEGVSKDDLWKYALDDCLNIIAKLPAIAAAVYRIRYNKGDLIPTEHSLDWAADYAHMLGLPDPQGNLKKLMRLYMVLHSDHEGGNVSAFTAQTVGSALSDPYYALSAGLNGLAGPLHGLANQECLRWILGIREQFDGVPTQEQLEQHAWDTLNSGQVIPGYGHAVLRVADPRFEAIFEFGQQHCQDDEVFQVVAQVYNVVPNVLKQIEKINNPWPNVDAVSGSVLYHYGLNEFSVYTVLFSVSRALGICAQNILARAMGRPITRPKSITTQWLKQHLAAS